MEARRKLLKNREESQRQQKWARINIKEDREDEKKSRTKQKTHKMLKTRRQSAWNSKITENLSEKTERQQKSEKASISRLQEFTIPIFWPFWSKKFSTRTRGPNFTIFRGLHPHLRPHLSSGAICVTPLSRIAFFTWFCPQRLLLPVNFPQIASFKPPNSLPSSHDLPPDCCFCHIILSRHTTKQIKSAKVSIKPGSNKKNRFFSHT